MDEMSIVGLIKWYKDENHLNGEKIHTKLVNENILYSELIIHDISWRDTGVYSCMYEGFQERSHINVTNQSKFLIIKTPFIPNN